MLQSAVDNAELSAEPQQSVGPALGPQRDLPIGGQAVLEGVMMRGISTWAVACRAPDGDILLHSEPLVLWTKKRKLFRLPVVRGFVALAESLKIGFQALAISANAQLLEEGEDKTVKPQKIGGVTWGLTIALSLVLGIGLFFVVPVTVTNFFKDSLNSSVLFWLVEGVLRVVIFLAYLIGISYLPDLKRVLQYHGAEHKTIAAVEAGDQLVPARVRQYPRLHIRCGTSFLLIVMIIAVFAFAAVGTPALPWLILTRILGVPIIAGLSYEVIKWAGRNRRKRWVRALMAPGLQLQKFTTREPDDSQLEVAIIALEEVLAVDNPAQASAEDRVGMEVVA